MRDNPRKQIREISLGADVGLNAVSYIIQALAAVGAVHGAVDVVAGAGRQAVKWTLAPRSAGALESEG